MSLGWKFPRLDGGPKQGINDGGVSTLPVQSCTTVSREKYVRILWMR